MRKLIVMEFLSLDGVMQAPGGVVEDAEGGFQHGGWQMAFDDGGDKTVDENLASAGALLLGRKTYDIFAAFWPNEGKDLEFFGPLMNSLAKYVASKTLNKVEWQNSNLLEGDVADEVAKLKSQPGKNIYVIGSGDLCQTLMKHHLVDEYILMVHPLMLGQGKRLFRPDGPKQELELLTSKTAASGIVFLRYKVKNA